MRDSNDMTALHHACAGLHYGCVHFLLQGGADPRCTEKVTCHNTVLWSNPCCVLHTAVCLTAGCFLFTHSLSQTYTWEVRIAQRLESQTRDQKVAGSSTSRSSGRNFSRVNFLYRLLLQYLFHPCVTTVAHKRSQSFCWKCKWQTALLSTNQKGKTLWRKQIDLFVHCTDREERQRSVMSSRPPSHGPLDCTQSLQHCCQQFATDYLSLEIKTSFCQLAFFLLPLRVSPSLLQSSYSDLILSCWCVCVCVHTCVRACVHVCLCVCVAGRQDTIVLCSSPWWYWYL